MMSSFATKMLEMLGYESSVARHGEEAIEMYKKAIEENAPFDAVILDLTVPGGMSGSETIKHLQRIDPDVKAIVSSGYFDDPVMAQYLDYGFIDFLEKPYNMSDLGDVLKRVIDQEKTVQCT